MKKLYKLKSWFSLDDAAERLSAGLGEHVTVYDILQMVIEGHIPLSWYARGKIARVVAPYTTLAGKGYRPELNNWIFGENQEDVAKVLLSSPGWAPIEKTHHIRSLNGQFRLELDYSPHLLEWLHSQLTFTGGKLGSKDGFFVSDNAGTILQVMDCTFDSEIDLLDPKDDHKRYRPTCKLPNQSELIITRQDIEEFERSLATPSTDDSVNLLQKAETSYLNMISALLDVISDGIPDPISVDKQIGPASDFSNMSKLISAIADHYKGYSGLSKRNLEKKFPAAKRTMNSS